MLQTGNDVIVVSAVGAWDLVLNDGFWEGNFGDIICLTSTILKLFDFSIFAGINPAKFVFFRETTPEKSKF